VGLDFSRLSGGSTADRVIEPRRIFAALPSKAPKYSYPRDVQADVWQRWHRRRTERDLVIKMNTGSGKTVVGLLLLKSCLNEHVAPAVYITPDIYLAGQVRDEASELGIETTDDPRSGRFRSGKAILVTHVHRLVNGLSVFGVAGSAQRIDLGVVLIDDVHACLPTVEDQFTLRVPRSHDAWAKLLSLFREDLRQQSRPGLLDVREHVRSAVLRVPFWAWADRQEQVLSILHPHRHEDGFKFVWPLIANCLPVCTAAVTADAVEIAPPCPPIDQIPSFANAKRRVYLTATLADDSVLVTHFGADPLTVSKAITPRTADDLGDRMILTPLETHPDAADIEIRDFLKQQARRHNVVVIVPSRRRAEFWKPVAAAIHDSATIYKGVEALRQGHVGLVVLLNKYDGIDLPHKACEILAIDGLPEAYSGLERLEALALDESDAMITRQVQRIEQGMGRAIRSNDDYCAVLLLGSRLTQRIHNASGFLKFSPATRAQLELSREVAEMLHDRPLGDLTAVIDQCLDRDPGWVTASRNALDGVRYDGMKPVSDAAVAQREAFDLAMVEQYRPAAHAVQEVIDATTDVRLRGWLKQQMAAYMHFADPVRAQKLLLSALSDNKAVTKPRDGIGYSRLKSTIGQAERCAKHLGSAYGSSDELLIGVNAILDDLVPNADATDRFEQAMHDLGVHIGFAAQRPERDTGEGPDVLWLLGDLKFLVIECKSGVDTDFIAKRDAAQLSHSMDWFASHYDKTCLATPVLVHKVAKLHKTAVARDGTRVITFERLAKLRDAVRVFTTSLVQGRNFADPDSVEERLAAMWLTGKMFAQQWGTPPRKP